MMVDDKFINRLFCLDIILSLLHFTSSMLSGTFIPPTDPYIIEHPENTWVAKNDPATLSCKAEGKTHPVITWYRNGQPVVTSNEDPESNRMLLPSGHLVFVRVSHTKSSKPDVGVYYCNATNPETKQWVVSRNATLEIAVIRDEFLEHPQDAGVLVGSETRLRCRPPKGEPEPRVKWKKDGQPVVITGRVFVSEGDGSLNILEAKKEDSGKYTCVGFNAAGEKDSKPATLTIREKPQIIQGPRDVQVKENGNVVFECVATGEPPPTILWTRSEGVIPQQRSQILEDKSLKINSVQVSDEGVYTCNAGNNVGSVELEARLTVLSLPVFVVTPGDKVVGSGREVQLSCQVTGNPLPAIFWNKELSKTFMFQGQNHGPYSVMEDGSLLIRSAVVEDSGEYTCQALSTAGSAFSKAKLVVKESENRLPPIISILPQNQTLPSGTPASLPCAATGDPAPTIHWFKNGRVVLLSDPRFSVTETGTLQIEDLKRSDSGTYTCRASSETGDTSWSCHLNVFPAATGPEVVFRRAPQPSAYPGPPTCPTVTEVTETSARVTWKKGVNVGASSVSSFLLQAFCFSEGPGWVVVASDIKDTSFVVTDLKPNSFYSFIVRANNSHGIGTPSPPSPREKTKDFKGGDSSVFIDSTGKSGRQSLPAIIGTHSITHINSSAINISWSLVSQLPKHHKRFDGYQIKCQFIKFLALDDKDFESKDSSAFGSPYDSHSSSFPQFLSTAGVSASVVENIYSSSLTHHVISGLRKFSLYELSITPFVRGAMSNEPSFAVKTGSFATLEDVPSMPPQHIQAHLLNNSTFLRLLWRPPPLSDLNGRLIGYKIHVSSTDDKLPSREIQVNASVGSIEVYNLARNTEYRIHLQAFNRIGDGPKSGLIQPKPMSEEVATKNNFPDFQNVQQKHFINETWFLGIVVAVIFCVVWLSFCVFCLLWYKRRKSSSSVPAQNLDKNAEVQRMLNVANSHQLGRDRPVLCPESLSQQQLDSKNKKLPLLKLHQQQMQGSSCEPATNLCHNCNSTLMTSCCYNESISDGECCRVNSQQHSQHSPSMTMNHHYHTLETQQYTADNQQYTVIPQSNIGNSTIANNMPSVPYSSSIATNRHLTTSHSNSYLGTNYSQGHLNSSPIVANYFSNPNSANISSNNNNNFNRAFRPIPQGRDSYLHQSSDEEMNPIPVRSEIPPSFQQPFIFLPPPPPVEDDSNHKYDIDGRNKMSSEGTYYHDNIPRMSTVYPPATNSQKEFSTPQQRQKNETIVLNPFYETKSNWTPAVHAREYDYDDSETYNEEMNGEECRSSDEVSSIEDDSEFINKVKVKKRSLREDAQTRAPGSQMKSLAAAMHQEI